MSNAEGQGADRPPATAAEVASPSYEQMFAELEARRANAMAMGGAEGVARHRDKGRYDVRQRIERLADPQSFHEFGLLAGKGHYDEHGRFVSSSPSNAVIGTMMIDGRHCVVGGDDFTIRGGSSESAVTEKWIYAERYAHEMQIPVVRLVDMAGGSVKLLEQQQSTKIPGYPTWQWISLLGSVPVVGIALGSCAGLGALKVAASHFSIMVKGQAQIFAGGPPVVKQGIGLDIDKEELGGWLVHVRQSGIVNNVAETEDEAFEMTRRFLSYLPTNIWELPPKAEPRPVSDEQAAWLDGAIPAERRKTYDPRRILNAVFDQDSLFEMTRLSGASVITALARFEGHVVGVLANDPRIMGGAMTGHAARKTERFVDMCDTFHIPIVNFVDQPGVMFGPDAERAGTVRDAMKAIAAIEQASVPWMSVIVRRAFGLGGGMHGPKHGPNGRSLNHRVAWPTARWGSIPIEGGVAAAYRRDIEGSPDPIARRDELEAYYHRLATPMRTAERFGVVDVIRPSETRFAIRDWLRDAVASASRQTGPRLRSMR
ncbi:MAG: carboxyl transferase domain-containing protein [Burkholderiaceae bacterium]